MTTTYDPETSCIKIVIKVQWEELNSSSLTRISVKVDQKMRLTVTEDRVKIAHNLRIKENGQIVKLDTQPYDATGRPLTLLIMMPQLK